MKISMRDYESIVNKIVNQIIFINALGDYEYHPEREDFLLDYFYLKYFTEYEFSVDYSFEEDIFSLEFYEDLAKEIESAMTEEIYRQKWNDIDFMRIKKVVADKVDFTKNYLLKKTSFSLTDTYLSELISKITEWLEDKGIEEFIKVVSETGEELGNKKLPRTKSKTK